MHESEGLPLSTSRQKTCREQQSDHSMPLNGTISECIYATAEYREGYYFGTKAARMHRLEAVPFPSKDPRHAGWSDALYDAWSARRLELSRAANRTADCRPGAVSHQLV
jgi:hypothetical protein